MWNIGDYGKTWHDIFYMERDWDIKQFQKACEGEIREKNDRSDIVNVFKYKNIPPKSKQGGFPYSIGLYY